MGAMTVRGLDEGLKQRLQVQAAVRPRDPYTQPLPGGRGHCDLPRVQRGSPPPAPDFDDGCE